MKSAEYGVGRKAEIVSAQITYIFLLEEGGGSSFDSEGDGGQHKCSLIFVFSAQEKL